MPALAQHYGDTDRISFDREPSARPTHPATQGVWTSVPDRNQSDDAEAAIAPLADRPGPLTRAALNAAYPVLAALFTTRGRIAQPSHQPIVVYHMDGVGSTHVTRSIRASRSGCPVYDVQTLTAGGIATMDAFYRSSGLPCLASGAHLLTSRYLAEQLERGVPTGRWKVISLVRDPVARSLSHLFQLCHRHIADFEARCDTRRLDPISVFDQIQTAFPHGVQWMRWFNEELRSVMGVDVFGVPFDRKAGHQVYSGRFADVLVIKTEQLGQSGEATLRSFLGLKQFRWKRPDKRIRGKVGERYAHFIGRLRLPASFVDHLYDYPELRHFYTAEELDGFRSRWCGARTGST